MGGMTNLFELAPRVVWRSGRSEYAFSVLTVAGALLDALLVVETGLLVVEAGDIRGS